MLPKTEQISLLPCPWPRQWPRKPLIWLPTPPGCPGREDNMDGENAENTFPQCVYFQFTCCLHVCVCHTVRQKNKFLLIMRWVLFQEVTSWGEVYFRKSAAYVWPLVWAQVNRRRQACWQSGGRLHACQLTFRQARRGGRAERKTKEERRRGLKDRMREKRGVKDRRAGEEWSREEERRWEDIGWDRKSVV